MSAQETNAPNDRYYLVDLTSTGLNALRIAAQAYHQNHAPNCELSINRKFDNSRAVVKVRNGKNFNTSGYAAILQTRGSSEIGDVLALVQSTQWTGL